MTIVSKPSTKKSKAGHDATFGPDHGHINAACCECPKCQARRLFAYAKVERRDEAGPNMGADWGFGWDPDAAHSVRVK